MGRAPCPCDEHSSDGRKGSGLTAMVVSNSGSSDVAAWSNDAPAQPASLSAR